MKNLVYKITFLNRKKNNLYPYKYIGSKSNCTFDGTNLIDKYGNFYYGSSTWENYLEIVKNENELDVEVLFYSEDYSECLKKEKEFHLEEDVVANPSYFNKAIATISNYSDPCFATFKHIKHNKVVRLPIDHPSVIDGTYVGVTKGLKIKHEGNSSKYGIFNPFFGKSHSHETKRKLSNFNKGNVHTEESKLKMSRSRRGKRKSESHKKKIGRKGLVNFVNLVTKEKIRITRGEFETFSNKEEWVTQAKYNSMFLVQEKIECENCGGYFIASMYKRFHGKNCSSVKVREYNPFKTLGNENYNNKLNSEVLYRFDLIVEFLKNNKKPENMSSRKYSMDYLIPFTESLFGQVKPFYQVVKRIYNSYRQGKITEETFKHFNEWKQKVDFNAFK